jgi:hypothetical protein
MSSHIYYALLCLQSGLSNHVIPQLRAVTAHLDDKRQAVVASFFYDCKITEELIEECGEALEEVYVGDYTGCIEEIIQLNYPKEIPIHGKLAYLRYESILPEFKKENRSFLLKGTYPPLAVYRLDMQEALLGKVTPALRHVSVGADPGQKKLIVHFIYDGEISELDQRLATAAIQESRISLPDYELDSVIERVDFPNKYKIRGKCLAYCRHESKYTADGWIPDLRN